jgi:transcriptional regulator with XRE-family HTH domain
MNENVGVAMPGRTMPGRTAGTPHTGEDHVAVRIRLEREARGWSTTTVSDRMNEAGFEMNPSAVWRIENRKRRVNLDEAIGFAEVFGLDLRNLVGPPRLAAEARAMELINAAVDAFRVSLRAHAGYLQARDLLHEYLARHRDIREEAETVVSDAMAQAARSHMSEVSEAQAQGS